MSEDWLDIDLPTVDAEKPADASSPGLSGQALLAGAEAVVRREKFMADWASLTDSQRVFLNTWRECRFNANKAMRVLANTSHHVSKSTISNWLDISAFSAVRELMRSASVAEILSRDYLAVRQEDIVETLLTPQPILHQGFATGHFEVQAGAASKANEVLLKLGGHLKEKDIEVNVGVVVGPPQLHIQVMPMPPSRAALDNSVVIDAKFTEVPSEEVMPSAGFIPEPPTVAPQADEDWLSGT